MKTDINEAIMWIGLAITIIAYVSIAFFAWIGAIK